MYKAKARFGHGSGRIIVDDCPFCHKTHHHNPPIGEGQRMADCFKGEYILDFDSESDEPKKKTRDEMLAESENNYKCPSCGTDCTAITCPADGDDWCTYCQMDVEGDEAGCCPHCGYLVTDLIEETDYLEEEEDDE